MPTLYVVPQEVGLSGGVVSATASFFEPNTTTPKEVYAVTPSGAGASLGTSINADGAGWFSPVYLSGPTRVVTYRDAVESREYDPVGASGDGTVPLADLAALRASVSSNPQTLIDGSRWITTATTGHGITDDGILNVVGTNGWLWTRVYDGTLHLSWISDGTAADEGPNVQALCDAAKPGDTIDLGTTIINIQTTVTHAVDNLTIKGAWNTVGAGYTFEAFNVIGTPRIEQFTGTIAIGDTQVALADFENTTTSFTSADIGRRFYIESADYACNMPSLYGGNQDARAAATIAVIEANTESQTLDGDGYPVAPQAYVLPSGDWFRSDGSIGATVVPADLATRAVLDVDGRVWFYEFGQRLGMWYQIKDVTATHIVMTSPFIHAYSRGYSDDYTDTAADRFINFSVAQAQVESPKFEIYDMVGDPDGDPLDATRSHPENPTGEGNGRQLGIRIEWADTPEVLVHKSENYGYGHVLPRYCINPKVRLLNANNEKCNPGADEWQGLDYGVVGGNNKSPDFYVKGSGFRHASTDGSSNGFTTDAVFEAWCGKMKAELLDGHPMVLNAKFRGGLTDERKDNALQDNSSLFMWQGNGVFDADMSVTGGGGQGLGVIQDFHAFGDAVNTVKIRGSVTDEMERMMQVQMRRSGGSASYDIDVNVEGQAPTSQLFLLDTSGAASGVDILNLDLNLNGKAGSAGDGCVVQIREGQRLPNATYRGSIRDVRNGGNAWYFVYDGTASDGLGSITGINTAQAIVSGGAGFNAHRIFLDAGTPDQTGRFTVLNSSSTGLGTGTEYVGFSRALTTRTLTVTTTYTARPNVDTVRLKPAAATPFTVSLPNSADATPNSPMTFIAPALAVDADNAVTFTSDIDIAGDSGGVTLDFSPATLLFIYDADADEYSVTIS